jgi:F-type H+-transporting ATPase subunit gamma
METLQGLERKIKSAGDLHAVVRTMKSLAAVEIRQYEAAVRSLSDYYHTVELGLRALLLQKPLLPHAKEPKETLLLIFGSDQGMVGRFNEAVIDAAENAIGDRKWAAENLRYWVVGSKAAGGVEERLGTIGKSFALPASARLITAAVHEVVVRFEQLRQRQGELRLVLCYNAPLKSAAYRQILLHLLPPDPGWLEQLDIHWPGRALPLYTLPWTEMFAALIGEYLFVSLFRAFASSMAAENAARLAAMQRAEKNIEEMSDELTARFHALRQSSITEELLDVISGFEALTS